MRNRKLLVVVGAVALVAVVFFTATVLAQEPEPEGFYNWYCNTAGQCGFFRNAGPGMALRGTTWGSVGLQGISYGTGGDGVWGYTNNTNGWALRGTAYGASGRGVYAYSSQYIGVQGIGGSGGGDYGGYFTGYEGVRGYATGAAGYGTWGTATGSSGRGAYGYANGSSGYGVYGYSAYYIGVYGSGDEYGVYGTGDEYGVYGYGDVGVRGTTRLTGGTSVYGYASTSNSMGVRGFTAGYGGDGLNGGASNSYGFGLDIYTTGANGYGARILSRNYRGLYSDGSYGTTAHNYYDAYFPDWIRVDDTIVTGGGWSILAQNVGTETLNIGDLVSFAGMDGGMQVEKANGANGGAVMGVVSYAYIMDTPPPAIEVELGVEEGAVDRMLQKDQGPIPVPEKAGALPEGEQLPEAVPEDNGADKALPNAMPPDVEPLPEVDMPSNIMDEDSGYIGEGSVEPGGFVVIVVQGFTQVNVDAAVPVAAGDWLVAASDGAVQGISERQLAWAERRGDVVIGRAMEEAVDGKVWVYVNFR